MTRPAPTPSGAALGDAAARAAVARRLAVGFLLDLIFIARGDIHVLDALLVSAVVQANVQEIIRRADLQLAYAGEDATPPDHLRRPVSMNALASSLDLPFETVRRRIRQLVRDGSCRFVDGGVIVPAAVLNDPKYYMDGVRGYELVRGFYGQAMELGLLGDLPPPTVELAPGTLPVRAIARLVGAYMLRVAERFGPVGDVLDGLVALEIHQANVGHLPPAEPDDLTGDGHRRPVAIAVLSRRLGVPHETLRRHAAGLMERGICTRVSGGLVVPAAALAGSAMSPVLSENAAALQRLFAGLAQLGVLKVWDGLREA